VIGGGSWFKRALVLDRVSKYGKDYLCVSESGEQITYLYASELMTVEEAEERQEPFRDEYTGKFYREMLVTLAELEDAPPPDWLEGAIRYWATDAEGMTEQFYGREVKERLAAMLPENAGSDAPGAIEKP
jgi:hypothetical protein